MEFVVENYVKIRKSVTTSLSSCYRSLCNHPFLVAFLLYLTFLQRFFPSLFSVIVTASPVFIYTVVLLGTLLSLGQSNLPNSNRKKKVDYELASLKDGVSGYNTDSFERDGRISVEKVSRTGSFVDSSLEEVNGSRFSSDHEGSISYVPLADENFRYTQTEKRELDSKESERNVVGKEKTKIEGVTRDVEATEKQLARDHSGSSLGGGGGDDEASDSASDHAKSSSPDASIADILPILDELNPLLDMDAPMPAHISHDNSSVGSDWTSESHNDITKLQSEEVKEDGADFRDSDDEEALRGKEDDSNSAIEWTEDDQMNLRGLKNLELERNQCLEKLIARRRASKRLSLAAEKNLIDLDIAENPFSITPLSTTRHNPFDPPPNPNVNSGLPPIPESAPPILLPRRNPFEVPYERNEEKNEHKVEPVQEEFVSVLPNNAFFSRHESFSLGSSRLQDNKQEFESILPNNAFFSRHESFNLGSSRLGNNNQERQCFKWRPIFVPEQMSSEGTSHSSIQREFSDSKLSSIPDTESVSSGENLDERKFREQDFSKAELIANIYHSSDLVDHRSHSSDDLDSPKVKQVGKTDVKHDEVAIKLGEVESEKTSFSDTRGFPIDVGDISKESHLNPEPSEDEKNSSNWSSQSSTLSEVNGKCSDIRKDVSTSFEPFVTEVECMSETVDENHHKEPVYDSSPSGSEKVLSFNSLYDLHGPFEAQVMDPGGKIDGATLKPHVTDDIERANGECNNPHLASSSHSEAHVDLPKTLNVTADSPEKSSPEQKKYVSDISMVEPRFDGHHNPHQEPSIILSEPNQGETFIKDIYELGFQEIHESGLKNVFPTTDESTSSNMSTTSNNKTSVVPESTVTHNVGTLPTRSNSKDETTEKGTSEILSSSTGTGVEKYFTNAHPATKQLSEVNVGEIIKSSSSTDKSTEVGTRRNTETTVKDLVVTPNDQKKVSEGNERELSGPSSSRHELTDAESNHETVITHTTPEDQSPEVETNIMESSKDIALDDIQPSVQETACRIKQVVEGGLKDLPKSSKSKDKSAEVRTNDIDGSSCTVHKNVPNSVKNVSESDPCEPPKSSNSNDSSAEVKTNDVVDSTIDVKENVSAPQKNVSESDLTDVPKPSSTKDTSTEVNTDDVVDVPAQKNSASESCLSEMPKSLSSKDKSAEVKTNDVVVSTSRVKDAPTISVISELPKSSKSKDESAEVKTIDIAGSSTSVKDNVPNPQKQVLESDLSELPKSSNSNDKSAGVANYGTGSTSSSVKENVPSPLKQDSKSDLSELPKSSNSKVESAEVSSSDIVGSTSSVKESVSAPLNRVSGSDQSELPKMSNSKNESANVKVNDKVGVNTSVKENVPTPLKQVSETDLSNPPKSLLSKCESEKVKGDQIVGVATSVKDNVSAPLKQVSESETKEMPKLLNSKDEKTDERVKGASCSSTNVKENVAAPLKIVPESNPIEMPKSSNSKDEPTYVEASDIVGSTSSTKENIPTPLKHVSESDPSGLPKSSNSKEGSNETEIKVASPTKEISEVKVLDIIKPSESETNPASSAKEIESVNEVSGNATNTTKSVQESVTSPPNRVKEGKGLPKSSSSNDRSVEVKTDAMDSTKSNITPHPKKVSEGNISEAQEPSNSKERSTEVPNTTDSTKNVQGTIPTKQVTKSNDGELSKPLNSKDDSVEVGTNVQESNPTHTAKQVSEHVVGELPKPSDVKKELPKVQVDVVQSKNQIPSADTKSGVQTSITTAKGDGTETPRPSNLEEGHGGEVSNQSTLEESNVGKLVKPTNPNEENDDELQTPANSKGWLWW